MSRRFGLVCCGLLIAGGLVGLWPSADLAISFQKLAVIVLGAAVFLVLSRPAELHVILSEATNLPCMRRKRPAGKVLRRLPLLRMTSATVPWLLVIAGVAASFVGNVLVDRNAWKLNGLNQPVYEAFAHIPRFGDLAFSQNGLAAFLVLVIPFAVALAVDSPQRLPGSLLAGALIFELLLTDSRAAMLSLALGSSLGVVYMHGRWRWLTLGAPLLAIGAIGTGALGTPSTGERLAVWQSALYMLADHPFTGIGLGMFQRLYPQYMLPAFHNTHPHAHNLVLQTWLDTGVLGAMGMMGLLGLAMAALAHLARTPVRPPVAIAAAISSAAMLLHAQVDSYFAGDPRTYWLMFIPMGILLSYTRPFAMPSLSWPALGLPLLGLLFSQAGWMAERRLGLETGDPGYLQAALRDGPKTEWAHFELAQALFASGDEVGAIEEWRSAKAGPYLVRQGMYDPALAVDPNDAEAREARLWTPVRPALPLDRLGRAAELSGDDRQAEIDYQSLSQLNPVGHYRLGTLYVRTGLLGDGINELEQAVRAIPNQEDFRLALAQAYVLSGEAAEARREYAAVLDLDPGNGDARAALAREWL